MPRVRKAEEAPREELAPRRPRVSVIERRLRDPYGANSSAPMIRLKDDPDGSRWQLRWVNCDLSGRFHVVTMERGWEPVRLSELEAATDIYDLSESTDGNVRRGEKGREVLMKMRKTDFEAIQRAKVLSREGKLQSSEKQKADLVEAAGKQVGDEAASYLQRHVKGTIEQSVERVEDGPGAA